MDIRPLTLSLRALALPALALTLAGCPDDDDADDGADDGSTTSTSAGSTTDPAGTSSASSGTTTTTGGTGTTAAQTGAGPLSLIGTARRGRTAPVADGQDGVGTLFVGAFDECRLDANSVGVAVVVDADVSSLDATIAFRIDDVPEGPVFVAAFLDDNPDADPAGPRPGPGDLVFADVVGDGVLSCVEVAVMGADATVDLVLNATVPEA